MNLEALNVELSDEEVVIAWAWATGHNAEWIAELINKPITTIRGREKQLRDKLGVQTRTHAIAIIMRAILGKEHRQQAEVETRRRGLVPIRLSDIPFQRRMSAARLECREANDEEAADLFIAAMFPSEKVYWVRGEAFRAAA